jgi:hypothetical protein
MRIHNAYMSCENRSTISRSSDFQVHQQHFQRRCYAQPALQRVEVVPGLSSAFQDLLLALPDLSSALPDFSSAFPMFFQAHRGVLKPITITPMVLLYQSSEISATLMAGQNALLGSDAVLKLTYFSLNSTSSQALLESSSD